MSPEDKLKVIHEMLADQMLELLKSGEVTSAEMNVIRQFLKDNNIDAIPRDDSPLGDIMKSLPKEFHVKQ